MAVQLLTQQSNLTAGEGEVGWAGWGGSGRPALDATQQPGHRGRLGGETDQPPRSVTKTPTHLYIGLVMVRLRNQLPRCRVDSDADPVV